MSKNNNYQNYNNNQNQNQEEEYVLEIDNKVKLDFPDRTGYTTTYNLTQAVNELFAKLFVDFYGATFVTQNGMMYLKMYFYEPDSRTLNKNEDLVRAFMPRQFDKTDNIGKTVMNMAKAFTSKRKYIETEDGFAVLKRYFFGATDKDFKLDQYISETVNPTAFAGMNGSFPLIEVFGFDLQKICRDIIEDITEDDEIQLSIIRQINVIDNFVNMGIKFTLIDTKKMAEVGNMFGLLNQNVAGNSNIILAKR
jgi:hypothetical protein